VLVRTDAAGATHTFAAHLAARGVEFSLGATWAITTSPPRCACCPAPPGRPPTRRGNPVLASTGFRFTLATGPGSPNSPIWSICRPGRRAPG
jgi:hypothetical protein